MNAARRARIESIREQLDEAKGDLEDVLSEEEEAFDNMSENLQMSDRGDKAQIAIDALENAAKQVDAALAELDKAKV